MMRSASPGVVLSVGYLCFSLRTKFYPACAPAEYSQIVSSVWLHSEQQGIFKHSHGQPSAPCVQCAVHATVLIFFFMHLIDPPIFGPPKIPPKILIALFVALELSAPVMSFTTFLFAKML